MGKGKGDAPAADNGLFGWKDWKFPKDPRLAYDSTPNPDTDGSYECQTHSGPPFPRLAPPGDSLNPARYPNASPAWSLFYNFPMPHIYTFWTDMTGTIHNSAGSACEAFELNTVECMEYYGMKQGVEACKDWYDDLMECRFKTKRMLRVKHMIHKRKFEEGWKYAQGKVDKVYEEPPKMNAFLPPHMDPYERIKGGATS